MRAWYAYNGSGPVDHSNTHTFTSRQPLCRNGVDLCDLWRSLSF